MLDRVARKLIDPMLEIPASVLVSRRVSANTVTFIGFLFGICGSLAISQRCYATGLVLILANRIADGLDGVVARRTGASDFGGFLDITLDIVFYASVPLAFAMGEPAQALSACFLVSSFMGTSGSFLAYAVIAAKQGAKPEREGRKSFVYSVGLMEGTETVIFFVLMCLLPSHFDKLAWTFGSLCWLTTLIRVIAGMQEFRQRAES